MSASSLSKELRAFIMRGNVVDLAVGVIIGVAFGGVVTSMVNDVLMPPIGLGLGGVDFRQAFLVLKEGAVPGPYLSLDAATQAGAVTLRYGLFINAVINFLIVAAAVFVVVKAVNRMMRRQEAKEEAKPPTDRPCPQCLLAIPLKATRCGHCTSEVRPV